MVEAGVELAHQQTELAGVLGIRLLTALPATYSKDCFMIRKYFEVFLEFDRAVQARIIYHRDNATM